MGVTVDDYPGNVQRLLDAGRYDEAIALQETLLVRYPYIEILRYNLAYTLKEAGYSARAISHYEQFLSSNPDHQHAHYGLAQALLAIGDFKRGWNEFEWRLTYRSHMLERSLTLLDLAGKHVLVQGEFGFGDMFQFVRYTRELKKWGATVYVYIFDEIKPLLSNCDYIDSVFSRDDVTPHYDLKIPMMSLPLLFESTEETIPNTVPYLYPDSVLKQQWSERLASDATFKIGICWQGKPNHFLEKNPLTRRSIDVSLFEPLSRIPGVTLYSLQHKGSLKDGVIDQLPFDLVVFDDLDTVGGRFMDTAAMMVNLDLVLSIDTSVVHLAAGLGVPTWVLIPHVAEWRWLKDRSDTPWYPNMRLFRQTEVGDWESVIQHVVSELRRIVHEEPVS